MMMIEQTFEIEKAEISVSFDWDTGDPQAGISAGWGEETVAQIKVMDLSIIIAFIPDTYPNQPVEDWEIDDVQVLRSNRPSETSYFADLSTQQEVPKPTLGTMPEVCAKVKEVWEQIQAQEELERLSEDCMLAEEEVFQIDYELREGDGTRDPTGLGARRKEVEKELDDLRKQYDNKKAAYEERYETK